MSDELPPKAICVTRREDRDLAVDEELHALDWTLPILHDDAMTVDADAALLRRLKVIPVLRVGCKGKRKFWEWFTLAKGNLMVFIDR